jgi:tetratricopeptide (TPR) repeat protein
MPRLRRPILPKAPAVLPAPVERQLAELQRRLADRDYRGVIAAAQKVLAGLPAQSPQRAEALHYLSNAFGMLKRFEEAYQAALETVRIAPRDSIYWYNLGQSARFTLRTGESLTYFEHAVKTATDPKQARLAAKELEVARKLVKSELKLRGPEFTLDDLIEQQGLFQDGMAHMQAGRWAEAEAAFRQVIALADVLPQPWGNLALALIQQRRFDEAEEALRRALKIDPKYDLARQNLAALAKIRRTGQLPQMVVTKPLAAAKVKQTVVFTDK